MNVVDCRTRYDMGRNARRPCPSPPGVAWVAPVMTLLAAWACPASLQAQGAMCSASTPFCTGTTYTFPASTNTTAETGPDYGCLTTRPNPAWYHLRVGTAGSLSITISQVNVTNVGVDVDFICWGPFTSPTMPCTAELTATKIVDCSFSILATEVCDIPSAQVGEYYILLLTNYSNQPATITFSQTGGTGATDCDIVANSAIGAHGLDWLHDAFPFNEDESLPGTIFFDTTTAMIKTGRNIAQLTGDALRPSIPGDTLVACTCGDNIRMDMVFRVKPGVGNYLVRGNRASGLRDFGTGFFASYQANPGTFSGWPGAVNPAAATAAHASAPSGWSEHVWNSARMDTAEINLFPVEARGNLPQIEPCGWAGMYHETDLTGPRASLGIARNRCFLVDPQGVIDETNIVCGSAPGWLTQQTGWDGNLTTTEGTKIIPDGLLTPGAHVQYFLRRVNLATPGVFTMLPDTNRVTGQVGEILDPGSSCGSAVLGAGEDGHRWQQFGVLPDRWKDPAFGEGGVGMACMLYVDLDDGFGDELAWAVAAEMIASTYPNRYGAHNGWHIPEPTADPNDPAHIVPLHGGQPGSTWDMYGVRGVDDPLNGYAGSIGSRLSAPPLGTAAGKQARIGPTERMLWTYYRMLLVTTGRFDDRILGPIVDRSQDDVQMLNAFRERSIGGNSRGCFVLGSGFATSESGTHPALLETLFGAELRASSYPALSGNLAGCVDMEATLTSSSSPPNIFGVENPAVSPNDVLQLSSLSTAAEAGYFFDPGLGGGPFVASTVAQPFGVTNWTGLLGAWDIQDLDGRFCPQTGIGRAAYLYDVFTNMFGSICEVAGQPISTTDVAPLAAPAEPLRVLRNPATTGRATFSLHLALGGHLVVSIRDVAGRQIRMLSSGARAAGSHELTWDGRNDRGDVVRSGIYFVNARIPGAARPFARSVVWIR